MLQGPCDLNSFSVHLRLWNKLPWVKFTPCVASLNVLTSVDLHQGKKHFLFKSAGGNFSYLQPHCGFISKQKVGITEVPPMCPSGIASGVPLKSHWASLLQSKGLLNCSGSLHLQAKAEPHELPSKPRLLEQHGHPSSEMQQSSNYIYRPTWTLSSG